MVRKPTTQSHNISDAELHQYALNILAGMTENVSLFPHPDPDLTTFKKMLKDFETAMADAAYRDRRAIIIRETKRKELQESIRYLSAYVHIVAKGDEEKILASGFIPSKPGNSSVDIPVPTDFRVTPIIGTGVIKLRIKAWRAARMYQFEYRKKGSGDSWTTVLSSKSNCTLPKLEMLEEYDFRVRYVGRSGKSPYSSVVSSRAY